jgi:drug/metabolite transporter (DMT)-like permease
MVFISTGRRLFLKKKLSSVQWSALVLLALGCTIAQMTNQSEKVLSAPVMGILFAVIMALLR